MRKILVVGAGQAGLQLALGLQARGHDVTVMSERTADEIRGGPVMSTQCLFATALGHEAALGLDFWADQAPRAEGLGVSVAGPDGGRPIDWLGRLRGAAQSVDQRVKTAGWMETFAERGGTLVIHGAAASDLEWFSRAYDLVLVAAGRGEIGAMFRRDAARSPYAAPQRELAVAYVHGLGPRPEHPDVRAVRCNLVPDVGALFVIPALTTSGPCDILFWEARPGGPADVFRGVRDPAERLRLILDLMRTYVPWEYDRAGAVELTDAGGTLVGRLTPTVREPVAELPAGGLALGVADAVVANDPLTGQGANMAAKCAAVYLEAITGHGDRPFDRAWMESAFDRFWALAGPATKWTNTMLGPLPEHVLGLFGAAGTLQPVADRFANGFDDPADFEHWFYDPERASAFLAATGAAG
ncbi:styrene monooxygenase/indole monooxygenase family protein [Actinacidiphila acididurans]|uniref:FAD-binding oxidoreductase n=1 Tax=Actinacidiphila acididurans TaxID=2784346 RepID=A0ABS2TLE6_9ACTN|nr:styrene monooxygenase/indole monooxygenase family protein [Actinacidiphila acididurans]MBM9503632.1 FAD-binding oxidoreductase [Actinacidiphila acididurans]